MESPIKFGTDGWRGIIARDFTFANVAICAQGVADYLLQTGKGKQGILIGYDTRFASEDFARTSAEVIAANGIKVYLSPKVTPTPVVSYGVAAGKLDGGIMITASHNPGAWNGFKYKTPDGASAPEKVVKEIEACVTRRYTKGGVKQITIESARKKGLLEEPDLDPPYFAQLGRLLNLAELRRAKLRVVVDPMFGAGIGYLRRLLEGGNIELREINSERNPAFPGMKQPEPVAGNLGLLGATVKKEGAALGIATDGDADRVGIMAENGKFISTLETFALLCLYFLKVRGERGAIIKTITNTSMTYRLAEIYHVPVKETRVGFSWVAPLMASENALIGGEESGGYGFRGHIPERDGILAGLYFIDFIEKTSKSPSALLEELYKLVGAHYFNRIDLTFPEENRQEIMKRVRDKSPSSIDGVKVAKVDDIDGFRFTLVDGSWLLIRFSGTEPLLRIYSESDSPKRVDSLLELGREFAGV
ncbi:MAG: phosphoglucomutase/phosphomannomutase family protein [Chloroflexota bacterium]